MKPDVVVIRAPGVPDSRDEAYSLGLLQTLWACDAHILVGMDWQQALASLPDDRQGWMLVIDSAWVSLDPRCLDRLMWALDQGADVAIACDSVDPAPMQAASYATSRGMERFVDVHELAVFDVTGADQASDLTRAATRMPQLGRVVLASLAGWRKHLVGQARVVRVGGAWAHDSSDFFASARQEVLPLVPAGLRRMLDVGGGEGGFLSAVKGIQPQVHTQLVELTEEAAGRARAKSGVDAVWVGDFAHWQPDVRYDCISFLDVLEHMPDPEGALRHARGLLSERGCVVMSLPNVGHWSVVADLLEGRWDWAPSGIHCFTHLRFFTRRTIEDMLLRVGLQAQAWLPVHVPCRADWLSQWQTPGLQVNTEALEVYAYILRAVPLDN